MSYLELLPPEKIYELALYWPYEELVRLCHEVDILRNYCSDPHFWSQKAQADFGVSGIEFNVTSLSPQERYLQLLSTVGQRCTYGSERYQSPEICLGWAVRDGNFELFRHFYWLVTGPNRRNILNLALITASYRGYRDIVNFLLFRASLDPHLAISNAISGKQVDVVMDILDNYLEFYPDLLGYTIEESVNVDAIPLLTRILEKYGTFTDENGITVKETAYLTAQLLEKYDLADFIAGFGYDLPPSFSST